MHQPKRGLANALLEAGRDISALVPQMYDISGWSHGLLWGATVHTSRWAAPRVPTAPVAVAGPTGGLLAPPGRDLALTVTDGKDVQAVNALLDAGVRLRRQDDGTIVVPASSRRAAAGLADRLGVRFTAARHAGGRALTKPVLAVAVAADELFVLRDLGFEVRPVSTAVLNAGYDLSGVDTLVVSSGLSYRALDAAAKSQVDALLARGGVVTRGATGARFNTDAGVLPARAVAGRSDANGVVAVHNGPGPVGAGAPPHSFVYAPLWFTDLGAGVAVDQRYAATPLVAGHWVADPDDGTGGPAEAAGQAAVVSGVGPRGTAAVLFGTEPLFRAHPKGLFAQVGRAIYWTATASADTGAAA
jgi:hypothetical protein